MTGNFLIQCKTRKMEVLQFLAVAFGSYVFGIIVMMIIRANTMEENECVTLGMLIAMAALVFVHFFGIIFSFVGEFNMAISMGATRRAYGRTGRIRTVTVRAWEDRIRPDARDLSAVRSDT